MHTSLKKLKGLGEKGRPRFLAKIEHGQNSSKFRILVCLGVLNNVLFFCSILLCSRDVMYEKKLISLAQAQEVRELRRHQASTFCCETGLTQHQPFFP